MRHFVFLTVTAVAVSVGAPVASSAAASGSTAQHGAIRLHRTRIAGGVRLRHGRKRDSQQSLRDRPVGHHRVPAK